MTDTTETNAAILDEARFDEAAAAITEGNEASPEELDGVEDMAAEADTDGSEPAEGEASADDAEPTEDAKEPAEGDEAAAEAKEEEPEPPKPEGDGAKAWEYAQARRLKKQADRQLAAVDQRLAALEQRERAIAAIPDPRTDTLGHFRAMAERAGMTEQQYLERVTGAQLRDGEPDPAQQYEHLQGQIAELKADKEQQAQAAQQRAVNQQRQSVVDSAVAGAMELHDPNISADVKAQAAERWPWVARAEPAAMRREMTEAAAAQYRAWEQRGELHLHDQSDLIAEAAGMVEQRYASLFGAPPKTTEDRDTSKARDGQGTPDAQASKPAGEKPRSLTNKDAALGGTTRRTLTDEDRWESAGSALLGD